MLRPHDAANSLGIPQIWTASSVHDLKEGTMPVELDAEGDIEVEFLS